MRRLSFFIWLGIVASGPSWSSECAVDPLAQYTQLGGQSNDDKIKVISDISKGSYSRSDFSGSVNVQQGDKHLFAPKITYDRDENAFQATQGIILGLPTMAAKGETGIYHIDPDTIDFTNADYYFASDSGPANGFAQTGTINRQSKIDLLKQVSYTTCDRNNPEWTIKAKTLRLDHNTNRGIAKNMSFNIGDVPIFWLPYFSFPLNNDRASGFLWPTIGQSSSRGFEFTVPYYWNISPNQDATVTLHPMLSRGLMTDGEYRFMTQNQQATISGSWLSHDKKYNDQRWKIALDYEYRFDDHWRAKVNYQDVSDIDYLDDINSGSNLYEDWYLDRYAAIYGKNNWGNIMLRAQDYERVSSDVLESAEPFSREPQFTYDKYFKINDFTFGIDAEAVRFYKEDVGSANRYNTDLSAAYRLSKSYGFIEPKISFDLTHYDLMRDSTDLSPAFEDDNINRAIPTLSIDAGLYFDRDFTIGGNSYTQTLEPRIFYLYTPYRDQSDIPLFDSSETSQSWNWLFNRNRFTGKDRIGDANQLTTALTSHFYRNSDGQEKLKLSVGQIQYFQDREVGLNGKINDDTSKSVIVTEGEYHITDKWQISGLAFWDTNQHNNEKSNLNVRYYLNTDSYVNIGHLYDMDYYDQLYIGGGWRFNESWRAFARYDRSLRYHNTLNVMAGIEYTDCCWAWRLVGRNYRDNPDDGETSNAIYLEFIFKGLGNFGSSTKDVLADQLPQFRPLTQEK